ncbi:gephyrin-like molybdotransferase Glp [uncultured Slackia sp.]|uniref:molybdopterin molybdotransferase MoeA n=1 Tax=uncultured Slackia sp. TaxID=665903 RepID=UPI0026E01296|nr:gephyrin-like molybdotransferase Glp [uncultured Slackia sp.]
MSDIPSMISLEEARALVVSHASILPAETVPLLDAIGRVAAADVKSDMDVSPFAHAAMDGFAVHASDLAEASEDTPVELDVIADVPAGSTYEGAIEPGRCVRIMTGAALPADVDSVVKYEIVETVSGDGKTGSRVRFSESCKLGSNVREAGEEAREGETVVHEGEVIHPAGIGFLAGCGALEVAVRRRPRVAIIPIGSELVEPPAKPGPGHIRNSNGYAMAACARDAGALCDILPIVIDDEDLLAQAVERAAAEYDFVVTTGGASNGDFDFIKPVVERLGTLYMTTVNMRPGKAQTFGLVNGTPVFGLPGNPAAAYMGFSLIIRPALRAMQGYTALEHPCVKARITSSKKKKDPRRIFSRATIARGADGVLEVTPAKNQSSGLFGVIQKSNCVAIMPEGLDPVREGDMVECILLDAPEDIVL